jgi:hypothetical protein
MPRYLFAAAVCGLVTASSQAQSWSFTQIADTTTTVPGGSGAFTGFYAPAADAAGVTFWGRRFVGSSTVSEGIYRQSAGVLQRIADLSTPVPPPRMGNFQSFNIRPASGGGAVGLLDRATSSMGSGGVYTSTGSAITRITDYTDPVPNNPTEHWDHFGGLSVDGSQGAYVGSLSQPWFVFGFSGSTRTLIAQSGSPQPYNPGGTFNSFGEVTATSQGRLLFHGVGGGPVGQDGLYTAPVTGGPLTVVADRTSPVPGHPGMAFDFFNHNGDYLDLDGPSAAFLAQYGGNQSGVFTTLGGALRTVIDTQTHIPGRSDFFTTFDSVSVSGDKVAFVGSNGNYVGLFAEVGGVLGRALQPGDHIGSRTVSGFIMGSGALYQDTLAVNVYFTDGTSGVFAGHLVPAPASVCFALLAGLVAGRRRRSR